MRTLLLASTWRAGLRASLLAVATLAVFTSSGSALTITLRSGNAPTGNPDPLITFLPGPIQCGQGFAAPFTAADFAAAVGGPNANVIVPYGVWGASLACDPLAKWIAPNPTLAPQSALFAYPFIVPAPCCIHNAKLNLCWIVDDWLGDLDSYPNPMGVYVNGVAYPISGGNHSTDTQVLVDITASLHCGQNVLYIYNRDAACVVSGLIFSATIDVQECDPTSTQTHSWGRIKSLYR